MELVTIIKRMIKLKINNQPVEVSEGSTILEAAHQVGVEIPTMCHMEGTEHFTSCMICLVKDQRNGRLLPSCSMPAADGMDIITDDEECTESRKAALELLLSDHVGDCEAPCQLFCPAHMNIPLMNRLIAKGDFAKALQVVKRDIALPAILGRICPAPCEAGCRRKQVDDAVAICHLKQFVADEDLNRTEQFQPKIQASSGKRIAVIGAGPAGLATAYYLQLKGLQVVVFEKNGAGGDLLKINEEVLPSSIIESEVEVIVKTGVEFRFGKTIDDSEFQKLKSEFDVVILATGTLDQSGLFGLKSSKTGIEIDKATYQTSDDKVFAIGNALRPSKLAVRSVGQGKKLAQIIDRMLKTGELKANPERFNSKFGKLYQIEFNEYLKDSVKTERQSTLKNFTPEEARAEAERCMHCDCRNPETCKLREYSDVYSAEQKRFQTSERKIVQKFVGNEGIVYEPAKCIKCGICVRITQQYQEEFGFSFIGRGFDVKIGVPFNESVQHALKKTAALVAEKCPTGALAMFNAEEQI